MPPFICLPPLLLDHSFPRTREDLELVSSTLGILIEQLESHNILLLVTDTFIDLVLDFNWEDPTNYSQLELVYRALSQLFLQPTAFVKAFDFPPLEVPAPHPLPQKAGESHLSEIWAHEMAIVLHYHDLVSTSPFIGIPCPYCFNGEEIDSYNSDVRRFPLVGPDTIEDLEDAFEWDLPAGTHQRLVSVRDAMRNYAVLGASEVQSPSDGSHYKVIFEGHRPWILDPNADPIPDRFLSQLRLVTGYPLNVIKMALIEGAIPNKRLKLQEYLRA